MQSGVSENGWFRQATANRGRGTAPRKTLRRALAPMLLCLSFGANGEPASKPPSSSRTFDGYTVQWSTAVTGFLPEEVTDTHSLQPHGRGALNIVVLKQAQGANPPATIEADVSATVNNLLGRTQDIDMREVTEHGRTSYLGSFDIDNRRNLRFDVRVRPRGAPKARSFHFQRRFVTE